MMVTPEDFWARVDKTDTCWLWVGSRDNYGYGRIFRRVNKQSVSFKAHRVSYELTHGPIPPDMQLDHLCRVRCCVRPDHLEPVTCRENVLRGEGIAARNARKTRCHNGHLLSERDERGRRPRCRICYNDWRRDWRRARASAS